MTKWLTGYVLLCIVAIGAALWVLLAAGGFSESGAGLYAKIALALSIILAIVGGMTLMVVTLSRERGNRKAAAGRDADRREAPRGRRDSSSEKI